MITTLRALAAALGGACGPRPTHHDPLHRACESHRRERERLESANHGLREVNAGLEAAVDTLAADVTRHKAARKRAGRMVRDLLHDLADARSERDAARAARGTAERQREIAAAERDEAAKGLRDLLESHRYMREALANLRETEDALHDAETQRDTAVAALAATREALAALPVHLRAAVALSNAGWDIGSTLFAARNGGSTVDLSIADRARVFDLPGCARSHPYTDLPAPAEGEHPALAVIRRAVAGEVLP